MRDRDQLAGAANAVDSVYDLAAEHLHHGGRRVEQEVDRRYIANVAAALEFVPDLGPGEHLFNYADQPDVDMNTLVGDIRESLGRSGAPGFRLPKNVGLGRGASIDILARPSGRNLPISQVRVEKFCANTRFESRRLMEADFNPEVDIRDALRRTVAAEFGIAATK